jgi:hypothetical protein
MNYIKLINFKRLRLWISPRNNRFNVWRKRLKRLGFIIFLGRVRLSFTLIT